MLTKTFERSHMAMNSVWNFLTGVGGVIVADSNVICFGLDMRSAGHGLALL